MNAKKFCYRLYGRDFVDKQRNICSFSSVFLSKVHLEQGLSTTVNVKCSEKY